MQAVFLKVLNLSLSASILILAIVILRRLFRKLPKWIICLLWGIVAVRLILPFSLESAFSLAPRAEVVRMDMTEDKPIVEFGIDSVDHTINTYVESLYAPEPMSVQPITDSMQAEKPVQVKKSVDFMGMLCKGWLIGIILLIGYSLFSYLRVYKAVRASLRSEGNVFLCDSIEMPFVLGIIRPRIYIPSNLNAVEQTNVLAHERAHIKRGDFLWKPLGFLLLTIYWFNPLIWVAYILLCRDIEMACDEKVVANMTVEEKKQYSWVLLSFGTPSKMITACPLAFGEVGVKERVKGVLNYRKPAFWVVIAALVVCIVLMVCFLTNPKEKADETTLPKLTSAMLETLYQQEFDKYSDKLPGSVKFDFISLSYDGRIYTASGEDRIDYVHAADIPSDAWEHSLADYPLEKICDVYGSLFVKPVHGALNADNQYADVYAWHDKPGDVKGEFREGTLWKFGEYDPSNLVALTMSNETENGAVEYELIIFHQLNGVNIATGKDLLDIIMNPMNARQYGVIAQPATLRTLSGDKPEDIYFLGALLKAPLVSVEDIKNTDQYETIIIDEKEPYNRHVFFRDYGDGYIGYCTPEGMMVYFKLDRNNDEAMESTAFENAPVFDNLASAVEAWANAFCARDGAAIVQYSSEEVSQSLLRSEMLLEEAGRYSFGYSSPWPMQEQPYRLLYMDEGTMTAEILYYAMTSESSITVWKETLRFEQKEKQFKVVEEKLSMFDSIETAKDFDAAYSAINYTWMDYTMNGLVSDLYSTAQLSNSNMLASLQEPISAAKLLLHLPNNENLIDTAYHIMRNGADRVEQNIALVDCSNQRSVNVLICLPGSEIYREIKMVKLEEYGNIWVPQDADYATGKIRDDDHYNSIREIANQSALSFVEMYLKKVKERDAAGIAILSDQMYDPAYQAELMDSQNEWMMHATASFTEQKENGDFTFRIETYNNVRYVEVTLQTDPYTGKTYYVASNMNTAE